VALSENRAFVGASHHDDNGADTLLRIRCSLIGFLPTNKMPDVDSYDSSSGIAVDVQQRLNCALP